MCKQRTIALAFTALTLGACAAPKNDIPMRLEGNPLTFDSVKWHTE